MPNRRKTHLDALERRLTGPRRIALFGHRNVGKTTLLAMFYREASTGRVPGVRMAAIDPASAEYLAEKIAQIEAGEPPAGTLAETELKLRLYHGPARLDLIVKDYQGEDVTLGSDDRPIHEFFADCDAVLLCLDPIGSTKATDRQRRQQEVEHLLEQYIERSDNGTTERPVALLVTKYDRVLAQEGPAPDQVEQLVESEYGMTRHALASHVPRSAIFAVSSYGRGAETDGRPPAELHPLGLEGPLGWLADQLEAGDLELLEWIWDLAPDDLPRLARCVRVHERRYPRSDRAPEFRQRLNVLRRRHLRRDLVRLTCSAALITGSLALYDAWGFQRTLAFERDHPAPAVRDRWAGFLAWHPSLSVFFPTQARRASDKLDAWTVKAAAVQVRNGTDAPGLAENLKHLKDEDPALAAEIQEVEEVQDQRRHDRDWRDLQVATLIPTDRPEAQLAALRTFLQRHPKTPHRVEAVKLAETLQGRLAERQARLDRQAVDALKRAATHPRADFPDLIRQAEEFLAQHPESRLRGEVQDLIADFARTLDEREIDRARVEDRLHPTYFASRIDRYQDYLKAHKEGGRFVGEANRAISRIEAEWDTFDYRQAYDHLLAHPDDVAKVAERFREYQRVHRDGRYRKDAEQYLTWWERTSRPNNYRVTLLRGEVEPDVGKYLGGGGPDLGVELEVAGVKHGPSTVIPNTHKPYWNYTFPRAIRWKYGDPISVRIIDHDWSDSSIFTLNSKASDKLAIRMLSGTIKPSKGGRTTLVFSSDFQMPKLSKPN